MFGSHEGICFPFRLHERKNYKKKKVTRRPPGVPLPLEGYICYRCALFDHRTSISSVWNKRVHRLLLDNHEGTHLPFDFGPRVTTMHFDSKSFAIIISAQVVYRVRFWIFVVLKTPFYDNPFV